MPRKLAPYFKISMNKEVNVTDSIKIIGMSRKREVTPFFLSHTYRTNSARAPSN
jgi:hypothetical protein